IPNLSADGRWHSVQFDLTPTWRAFWLRRTQARPPRVALRPMLGSLDNHAYGVAGLGGNRFGAAYAVSDLSFMKPEDVDFEAPGLAKVVWPFDPDGDGASLQL